MTAVQCDRSKVADLDRLHDGIGREKSHLLAILFANAAVGCFTHASSINEENFDRVLSITVKGVLSL